MDDVRSNGSSATLFEIAQCKQTNGSEGLKDAYNKAYSAVANNFLPIYRIYVYQEQLNHNVKQILKEKWQNVALISALLLSITAPSCLNPPEFSTTGEHVDEELYTAFLFCSGLASTFLLLSIFYVFQLIDAMEIHVTDEYETLMFIREHVVHFDVPQWLMFLGIIAFFLCIIIAVFMIYECSAAISFTVVTLIILITLVTTSFLVIGDTMSRAADGNIGTAPNSN